MGAILKNKAVFLHVPKTGGNWVIEIFKKHDLFEKEFKHKHSDAGRMHVVEKNIFADKPFIFCFVRHPVTWMESWYRYQKKRKFKGWGKTGNLYYHPCSIIDDCQDEDFNKFVSNIIDKVPGFVSNMYFQYTRHCAYVGSQEDLAKHTKIILEKMNVIIKPEFYLMPRMNVSKNYEIVWDKKTKNEFQKFEISGMKQYGYKTIT
jgi:hypothetical protein